MHSRRCVIASDLKMFLFRIFSKQLSKPRDIRFRLVRTSSTLVAGRLHFFFSFLCVIFQRYSQSQEYGPSVQFPFRSRQTTSCILSPSKFTKITDKRAQRLQAFGVMEVLVFALHVGISGNFVPPAILRDRDEFTR